MVMKTYASMFLLFSACAPDLRKDFPFDGQLPEGSYVEFSKNDQGFTTMKVNATFKESWVYVDLDEPKELQTQEALSTAEWDVAFQRFKIISNGGFSGPGTVNVAILKKQDFDALSQAPSEGYVTDAVDSSDADTDVDSAFLINGGWYYYDLLKHRLTPNEVVYVLHTTQGKYLKFQMLSYYDSSGTPAQLSMKWQAIAPPNS